MIPLQKLDFSHLEEMFKLSPVNNNNLMENGNRLEVSSSTSVIGQHSPGSTGSGPTKKNSLLDTKRLQNVAITRRKLALEPREIMAAVHQMDLDTLSADKVDILSRILPNDEERKLYAERGDDEGLSDEDRFMAALCEIERLEHKLSVMRVMADFDESVALLEPLCLILVQWDSVLSDMKELEAGFETARKERALKRDNCPTALAEFLKTHDERMKQLQEHAKLAV
ncbi:hypothetical protein OSTOST_20090 [Ostertagia ostertagi]